MPAALCASASRKRSASAVERAGPFGRSANLASATRNASRPRASSSTAVADSTALAASSNFWRAMDRSTRTSSRSSDVGEGSAAAEASRSAPARSNSPRLVLSSALEQEREPLEPRLADRRFEQLQCLRLRCLRPLDDQACPIGQGASEPIPGRLDDRIVGLRWTFHQGLQATDRGVECPDRAYSGRLDGGIGLGVPQPRPRLGPSVDRRLEQEGPLGRMLRITLAESVEHPRRLGPAVAPGFRRRGTLRGGVEVRGDLQCQSFPVGDRHLAVVQLRREELDLVVQRVGRDDLAE